MSTTAIASANAAVTRTRIGRRLIRLDYNQQRYDVIVIGGGAAGLMCAFTAGRRGRRVALLECNARVGLKIPLVFDAHTLLMSELPYYSIGLPTRAKATLGRSVSSESEICDLIDSISSALVGEGRQTVDDLAAKL